jgi:hypothetical protein
LADPRSLATTNGVSVDFLSSRYLDVSVPWVCSLNPIYSGKKYLVRLSVLNTLSAKALKVIENKESSSGFPHSDIHGSKLILNSPWLFAEYHVLHRLLLPRHPPNALFALDSIQKKISKIISQNKSHYLMIIISN